MAWIERFTCDICGKLMGESESWWVAVSDRAPAVGDAAPPPILKLMPWDNLHGHSAGTKHLCGAACAHRYLDRWMAELHAGAGDFTAGSSRS